MKSNDETYLVGVLFVDLVLDLISASLVELMRWNLDKI